MGTNLNDSWERIQQGVKDTERLIGQRDYNASMVKARQTLEFMVTLLTERSGIAADTVDLKGMIDNLYQNQAISKTTCEHYHKIRIIGNKAVHEGDTNAYNANQAYHMLSQEIYTFAHDYRNLQRGGRASQGARSSSGGTRQGQSGTRAGQSGARQGQSGTRSSQGARRPSSGVSSRRRQPQRRAGFTIYDLLKILVPILCIILLFCVIRLVKPGKDTEPTTTAAPTTEVSSETTAAPEPETEAATAAAVVYKTTSVLNVRPQPNTTDARIGQLDAGVTVEYVRAHDDEWAVIMYNGQEAYVASQYLTTE